MKTTLLFAAIFLAGILLSEPVTSQSCNCASNLCCSKYGYCGTTSAYCGNGCQGGPCSQPPPTNNADVPGIVTSEFFNGIAAKATGNDCPGRGFYTRDVFLNAIQGYPRFGKSGSIADSKREIAAFFAHVTHETGFFCHTEEINRSNKYCDKTDTQYPCNPSKSYYGRGPIQITGNYNYGAAGRSLGFDGVNDPEIVARDPLISFKTALWFWMNRVHQNFASGNGFGATIRAVNGGECRGGDPNAVSARVRYYTNYCNQLGVETGPNLRC